MKTEITTKELEEAMNAVLKQARKMEESDEPEAATASAWKAH